MLRRLLATSSAVALAATLITAPTAAATETHVTATAAEPTPEIIDNGGFETPLAVGDNPTGWQVIGMDTNPVQVADVGAGGSSQSIKVPGRTGGSALAGLAWEFSRPLQSATIEFAFAVPEMADSSERTFEFWTRSPGNSSDASQVTINYEDGVLQQVSHHPGIDREKISGELATSDPDGTMNWYRIRIAASQDSDQVDFWLSEPNQPLPEVGSPPTATTYTWYTGDPIGSINMGFNHLYDPAYYFVDDVSVRGIPEPSDGPTDGSLDPFDGTPLISNSDFEYDSLTADPAGWTRWPGQQYDADLGVAPIGADDSEQSARVTGAGHGTSEALAWIFDEPQSKVQIEFSLAFLKGEPVRFWTGGLSHYSGAAQIDMRVHANELQFQDLGWRNAKALAPSVDNNADGVLTAGADDIHWNRIRLVTTKDGGHAAVWVAQSDGTFTDEPTSIFHTGATGEPIGSLAFEYGVLPSSSTYYVDRVTARGIVDSDPGMLPEIDRYQLWDGLEGPRTYEGAPRPEGMTVQTIHAPVCPEPEPDFVDDIAPGYQDACSSDVPVPEDLSTWDSSCPNIAGDQPAEPTGTVQKFLHGMAIGEHNGMLWTSWENGPKNENSSDAMQRGRCSTDWGATWSSPVVIGPDPAGDQARSHGAFMKHDGNLYALVAGWGPPDATAKFRSNMHTELWKLDDATNTWSEVVPRMIDNLWPLEPPRKMDNGNYIVGGVTKDYTAVVAISHGDDIEQQWTTIELPNVRINEGAFGHRYTETATWVDGSDVTAVMRNQGYRQSYRAAAVAVSHDYGQTWETAQYMIDNVSGRVEPVPQIESNLPQTTANIFVGTLSTGQRYLIGNINDRGGITIQVSRPGEHLLSRTFLINDNAPPYVYSGGAKGAQYNQPYAIEVTKPDGENYLYVVYSDAKERGQLAIIPVASLQTELPALASASLPSHVMVQPGGTVSMPASAARVDGVPLDLDVATVTYHTDRPDLVSFDGDRVTVSEQALGLPPVQVWVQVSFGGRVVTSPAVQVHVQPTDVHDNNPFYDDLAWALTHGVAEGYPDGTFQPLREVSRGQWAAFVWRSEHPGQQDPTCDPVEERTFDDVSADLVLCGVIEALAAEGVTNGYPGGTFRPGADIKRGQLAAFLFRWLHPGAADPECSGAYRTFVDVPASLVLCGDIEWLAAAGLTLGYPDGTFHPGDAVTRQSAAAFLHRVALLPADGIAS